MSLSLLRWPNPWEVWKESIIVILESISHSQEQDVFSNTFKELLWHPLWADTPVSNTLPWNFFSITAKGPKCFWGWSISDRSLKFCHMKLLNASGKLASLLETGVLNSMQAKINTEKLKYKITIKQAHLSTK